MVTIVQMGTLTLPLTKRCDILGLWEGQAPSRTSERTNLGSRPSLAAAKARLHVGLLYDLGFRVYGQGLSRTSERTNSGSRPSLAAAKARLHVGLLYDLGFGV